ncbi:permease-like cell division protein FtsX [Candidatus Margulisiibacteriota bacterium]
MLNNLRFFVREAWTGLRRSGVMSLVAIGTVVVSLIVFGVFLILIVNIGSIVGSVSSSVEIAAYVDKNISHATVEKVGRELSTMRGVSNVRYISREDAWKKFKVEYGKRLNLDEAFDINPLPDTFIVEVSLPELVPEVANRLSEVELISDVRYSGKLLKQLDILVSAVRVGGLILVGLLSAATLFIIMNTIRLTVIARETDISIMKLVGATDSFIKWPFIIEGVIIGMLGSFVVFFILKFTYDIMVYQLLEAMPFLPLVTDQGKLSLIYLIVGAVGTLLGMLGGYISVSKLLKEIES